MLAIPPRGFIDSLYQSCYISPRGFIDSLYHFYIYERPSKHYQKKLLKENNSERFRVHVERLCRDGIVILPNYFSEGTVRELQADFQKWFPFGWDQ